MDTTTERIWIDLDNTPHVPFFRPVVRELEAHGHTVAISARDAFQVCDLADLLGLRYVKIGRHYGRNRLLKIGGLLWRCVQLLPFVLRHRPTMALSHGSRSQILLCNLLGIPTVMVMDYEHARTPSLLRPRWEIVPSALRHERLQCRAPDRIRTYPGIKEDVYAPEFVPDDALAATLGLDRRRVIVTVRPPATEAHYHDRQSDALFVAFMERARATPDVQLIVLPRNKAQEVRLKASHPQWFADGAAIIPAVAVDGLNLLWHSDLVVSGGGTMNREAAALGIPVYSIFRGPIGAVDRQLQREGRLTLIDSIEGLDAIAFRHRATVSSGLPDEPRAALATIVAHVEAIAAHARSSPAPVAVHRAGRRADL